MKIVFTGDLFTGGDLYNFNHIINIDVFNTADIRVTNLEQAASNIEYVVNKSTVHSPLNSLDFLKQNKIDFVSLANNHIQDMGESGFLEMLDYLDKNNICYFGAGRNINEASRPILLENGIALLGYCDYKKPYLKKIQIANDKEYGVNPLSKKKIFLDLETIDDKAILYFHWGKENVWFPPYENIQLAKDILEHPKVIAIIGMHSHRIQGKLKHNGKYAFFSLGNFLFPSFYLMPRTQLVYPVGDLLDVKTTKEYHPVFSLTKKKWKYSSRVSVILILENGSFNETFVKQKRNQPIVVELVGVEKQIIKSWYTLLSFFYKLPSPFYFVIEKLFNIFDKLIKFANILGFYILKERKYHSLMKLVNDDVLKKHK
jgi:hypothetical protein